MRTIIFILTFLCYSGFLGGVEFRLFEGTLDEKGTLKIEVTLPEKEAFMVQGYILYRESWRPIRVFWTRAFLWADLGPDYRGLPYRVHLQIP